MYHCLLFVFYTTGSVGFPVQLCGIHLLAVFFVFTVECVKVEFSLSPLLFAIYVDDLSVNLGNLVMACILAPCSLVLFYTLMTLHCWLVAALANIVCNGISDLIRRKVSWHALAETPLVITSSLLAMSTCPGLCR